MPHEVQGKVTSEPEQDLFCPVCQHVGTHFCEEEVGKDRTGRLRAYGNAIDAEATKAFIEAYKATVPDGAVAKAGDAMTKYMRLLG